MSNGNQQRCCILLICCPPGSPEAKQALADALYEKVAALKHVGTGGCWDAAVWITDNFDLVPKGAGSAIVEAYRPEFAKLHAHKEADHAD